MDLFIIGYLLMALLFLTLGLCLLISPGTYFALLDRAARVDLWTKPSGSWNPTAPRWRVLGAMFTLFALLMVVGPPLSFFLSSPKEVRSHFHSSQGASWGAVAVLLFFVALGIGFLTRPLAVLDRVSPRKLSDEPDVQRHEDKLRIFGGVLLVVALLGICVQLIRYFRH